MTVFSTLPTPATFGPNEELAETKLNTGVRDPAQFAQDPPQATVRHTAAQSIGGGVAEALNFNAEDLDNYNGHDTVTNNSRYVVQISGKYQMSGGVGFASNGTGYRSCVWRKNGSIITASGVNIGAITGNTTIIPARTITEYFDVGDYIELWGFQNSGGALNTTSSSSDQSGMCILYVGSAST